MVLLHGRIRIGRGQLFGRESPGGNPFAFTGAASTKNERFQTICRLLL